MSDRVPPLLLALLAGATGLVAVAAIGAAQPMAEAPVPGTVGADAPVADASVADAAVVPTGRAPLGQSADDDVALTASTEAGSWADREPTWPVPDGRWVAQVAAATGIPDVAVRAYGAAVLRLDIEDPSCRISWPTLAAVGAVESGHGTHGGATLGEDGRSTPPIIGPALDGDGVAAIPATPESTALHGDEVWDHAVGAMQFLPSTWERWGADGDGDGMADPNDLDDAALASARYLCAGLRDLSTGDGWRAAILSYNHSDVYLADVLELADAYALTAR